MSCEAARAAMEEQFAGEAQTSAQLLAHLGTCAACRERYERLARVDLALERGGLSTQRLEALQSRVLGTVSAEPEAIAPPRVARRGGWPTLLAAAVLVAVVAIPVWRATRDDGFTPRGQAGATWGVRAFCVAPGPRVTGEALPGGTLKCTQGSTVQFTYTAPQAAQLSIVLEGTDLRLFPAAAERAAVDAGTDVALPSSTPVGDWLAGPRRVTARFTDSAGATAAESTLTLTP